MLVALILANSPCEIIIDAKENTTLKSVSTELHKHKLNKKTRHNFWATYDNVENTCEWSEPELRSSHLANLLEILAADVSLADSNAFKCGLHKSWADIGAPKLVERNAEILLEDLEVSNDFMDIYLGIPSLCE